MSSAHEKGSHASSSRLEVPGSLKQQLRAFRARVWSTKVAEAFVTASSVLLLAYLTVYVADRFLDTPRSLRFAVFVVALVLWLLIPWVLHRWVWRNRRLDQLARLLRVREPSVGDQLLSVIELAESDAEQARSRTLCAAAIRQVAETAKSRDFTAAAPPTRLRGWSVVLGISGVATLLLSWLFPTAAGNAWARFTAPWRNTPRFTFTSIEPLAAVWVVPHGEATPFSFRLAEHSQWQPALATLQIEQLPAMEASNVDGDFRFELPPQTTPVSIQVRVGDYAQQIQIQPKVRPELTTASASVTLPAYLERTEGFEQDVRSGALSVVEGSTLSVKATGSRELASAKINNAEVAVDSKTFSSMPFTVGSEPAQLDMWWRDHDGLAGSELFHLDITPAVDELPSVLSQDLPRQAVVLENEQINFQALVADDYGIKRIGMSWQGVDEEGMITPAVGEKVLAAGSPLSTSMQVPATFSASALGIVPQPVEVRLWTEDYYPGRERSYTPGHLLYVLTAEEHAIWIANQLSKWQRAALDVRDKEMQLHEENKRLRAMSSEELADDQMREELRRQAGAENSNARRLNAVSKAGESLLRQAARNPEIGVGHLESWAEMLQVLNDIGQNRMPSVADLLEKAASQRGMSRPGQKPDAPQAGQVRARPSAGGASQPDDSDSEEPPSDTPELPSIADVESTGEGPAEESPETEQQTDEKKKKKESGARLSLAQTTLIGPPDKSSKEQPEEQTEEEEAPVQMAIDEQASLLEEFEKITEELNSVLANLEGSTLVKRLKAAAREQNQVAEKIGRRINTVFGRAASLTDDDRQLLAGLAEVEEQSSQNVSFIMDDLQAYYERRQMLQFKLVLDDMKASNVLDALKTLGEDLPTEHGISMAQAEYWSDTLDRWGEDLVEPSSSGQSSGSKGSDALPPTLILEVLKILEGEVNLREQTRVAEQARPAVDPVAHGEEALRLSTSQAELRQRTDDAVAAIMALPDGANRFSKETGLLASVSEVMSEATNILATHETGATAIAAETEAIELLLQAKRINPKAEGGSGASPGGGGSGTTEESALALLGSGLNQHERREPRDVTQATGEQGRILPEEFRAGLDEYFNRLEQ